MCLRWRAFMLVQFQKHAKIRLKDTDTRNIPHHFIKTVSEGSYSVSNLIYLFPISNAVIFCE